MLPGLTALGRESCVEESGPALTSKNESEQRGRPGQALRTARANVPGWENTRPPGRT